VLTVACGGETRNPDVNAGLAAGDRQQMGRHVITGEHSIQRHLAFDLMVFHPTTTWRCIVTLTWPMPCKYTRLASGSQRAPSRP